MALAVGSYMLNCFDSSKHKHVSLSTSIFHIPSFFSRQKQKPCYIHKLPPETLTRIFQCLDWQELLAATMICQRWQSIIDLNRKGLWRSCALKVQSEWVSTPMEMSIENFIEFEIQRWVVHRRTVQTAWFSETGTPSLKLRPFNIPDGIVDIDFIPGGRWLLATDKRGRLLTFDLNKPEIKPSILVDPGQGDVVDKSSDKLVRFKTWINPRSNMLSFHVVMWNDWKDRIPPHDDMKTRTFIYQVDLVGYGERTFLSAMPLATWRDPCVQSRAALAVNGMYLVELWSGEKPYLSLLRYSDTKIENIEKERVRVELPACEDFSDVHFTTEGTIMVNRKDHIDLYTIGKVQGLGYKRSLLKPIRSVSITSTTENCSKPFNLDNVSTKSSWVVSGKDDGIYLVKLDPSDVEDEAQNEMIQLANIKGHFELEPEKIHQYYGSRAMIALRKDRSLLVVAYCPRRRIWHKKEVVDPKFAESILSYDDIRIGALDEGSGRIILVPRRASDGQTCTLLDTI